MNQLLYAGIWDSIVHFLKTTWASIEPFVQVGLEHYLIIGALLFVTGVFTVLSRKNAVAVLMGVELMLNAACLNFVAFSRYVADTTEGPLAMQGQVFAVLIIVLAAAEAAVALAIVLGIYQNFRTVDIDETTTMSG